MKITMRYEEDLGDETRIDRTVIVDEPGPAQIEDLVLLFKSFLLVIGYHPNTVNEWIDPHDEYHRKETADE